eukprot:4285926-Heterocapsa_arctica.AAC.1
MTGGRVEIAKPKNIDEDPDDSAHKHTQRKKYNEEENADKKNEEDNKYPDDGIEISKQARNRAEDRQSDINKAKTSKHIIAHLEKTEFDILTSAIPY